MAFPAPFYRWRPHPWHGLEVGPTPPSLVNAYIEITPFDMVKYELDKVTGYLHVDRPQRSSALPPNRRDNARQIARSGLGCESPCRFSSGEVMAANIAIRSRRA